MVEQLKALVIAVLSLALMATVVWAQAQVSHRAAGRATLDATPIAIGSNVGRIDLHIQNTGANDMLCGYVSADLSETDGATAGFRYVAGAGKINCQFPDIELYCMSTAGTEISFDQSYVATPTPTP